MMLDAAPAMIWGQRSAKDATSVGGRVGRLLLDCVDANPLAIPVYRPAQFVHGRQRAAVDSDPGRWRRAGAS